MKPVFTLTTIYSGFFFIVCELLGGNGSCMIWLRGSVDVRLLPAGRTERELNSSVLFISPEKTESKPTLCILNWKKGQTFSFHTTACFYFHLKMTLTPSCPPSLKKTTTTKQKKQKKHPSATSGCGAESVSLTAKRKSQRNKNA